MRRRRGNNSATLDTELGEFRIEEQSGWSGSHSYLYAAEDDEVYILLVMPNVEDPERAELRIDSYLALQEHQIPAMVDLLKYAEVIVGNFNEAIREEVEAAEEKERQQEQREEEERAAKDAITDERKQMLLNELMGEVVRVRHIGYRTTAKAQVESRGRNYNENDEPTQWEPTLRWDSRNNANRRRDDVENWKLLDVKTDKGWRNVWNDGDEDIGGDRAEGTQLPEAKPWTGGL